MNEGLLETLNHIDIFLRLIKLFLGIGADRMQAFV